MAPAAGLGTDAEALWKQAHSEKVAMKRSASTTSLDESPVSIDATFCEPILPHTTDDGMRGWLVSVGGEDWAEEDLDVMPEMMLPGAVESAERERVASDATTASTVDAPELAEEAQLLAPAAGGPKESMFGGMPDVGMFAHGAPVAAPRSTGDNIFAHFSGALSDAAVYVPPSPVGMGLVPTRGCGDALPGSMVSAMRHLA